VGRRDDPQAEEVKENEGGGASRSTDPAAGSSAATDVSLREFVAQNINALDRHMVSELAALRRESETANLNAQRAIEVAALEAKERLIAHNGLIEQMREQATAFASRESVDDFKDVSDKRFGRVERFQASLMGGLFLLSLIGIANLVKVWTG
jgi:conjugal transfer/entry exclusion protein